VVVYVGEVVVNEQQPAAGGGTPEPIQVHAGEAIVVAPGQTAKKIAASDERFIRELAPLGNKTDAEAAYVEFVKKLRPVVWYRMESKETERVLHDEMGSADAKLTWDGPGNPFVKGQIGKSLWLRGPKLKDYAIAPDYPKAKNGKLSVAAWIWADNTQPDGTIAGNWRDSYPHGQFRLGLGKNGELEARVNPTSGPQAIASEDHAHPLPLYQWQHVVLTNDDKVLRLYRQGREVATVNHRGLRIPVEFQPLTLGMRTDDSGTTPTSQQANWWDGKLDEFTIFNTVLSADDIRKLSTFVPR
jgi:hypothetical protein